MKLPRMFKCPHCNYDLRFGASTCPYCFRPTRLRNRAWFWLIIAAVVAFFGYEVYGAVTGTEPLVEMDEKTVPLSDS
ncbi:hypothetical protein [Sagittula stellata]|nr:hypothetical protein [Sagittula stellata]